MLNQKKIIFKHNHIVVISANAKPCITRPKLDVLDIFLEHFGIILGPLLNRYLIAQKYTVSTTPAGRAGETKKSSHIRNQ